MPKVEYIMIHHSGVSYRKNKDQFKATNKYHKSKWNFKSSLGYYVGYNAEISSKGKVYTTRADGEVTAACYQQKMNNGKCLHVCLDGNFDTEQPTPAQIYALRDWLKEKIKKHKIKQDNIIFHRNYADKTCPGMNLDIGFIRSLAGENKEAKKKEKEIEDKKEEILKKINDLVIYIKEHI